MINFTEDSKEIGKLEDPAEHLPTDEESSRRAVSKNQLIDFMNECAVALQTNNRTQWETKLRIVDVDCKRKDV